MSSKVSAVKQEIMFQTEWIIVRTGKRIIKMKDADKIMKMINKGTQDANLEVRS